MSEAYRDEPTMKQSGKAPKVIKTAEEAHGELKGKLMEKLNRELEEQEKKKSRKQR